MFFGIVENIVDPVNCGRVQVRVMPHYRSFAVEDLPWAYVLRSTDLGNTFGRGLNQHNLIEGSQVLVEYLDRNMQQPVVLGIVPRESDFAEMQSYLTHTLKFLNGSEITVDETPGEEYIKIVDVNKNYVLLNTEGITIHSGKEGNKIVVESDGDVNIISKTNTTITAQGDTKISTKGDTSINTDSNTTISTKGNTSVKSDGNMTIKSTGKTEIEASKLSLKNILGPNKLCSLPACLFTGTPHQSPTSD